MGACHLALYRTRGPDWAFKHGQVRDAAGEQKGWELGASRSAKPIYLYAPAAGDGVWGSPAVERACGHRGSSWLAAGSRQHRVALCDLSFSWQTVLEKASRGNRTFLEQSRGCLSTAPAPLGVSCLGGKAPPGGGCAQLAAPQGRAHRCPVLLPFGSACSSAGLWAMGLPCRVSVHTPSARRIVGRRQELGFESRGPGLAFLLHQQLPRQSRSR